MSDYSKRDPDVAHRLAQFTRQCGDHGEDYLPETRHYPRPENAVQVPRPQPREPRLTPGQERDYYRRELERANETIHLLEDKTKQVIAAYHAGGWTTGALLVWMLLAFCAGMIFSGIAV